MSYEMRDPITARAPIVNGILWLTAIHMAVSAVIFIFWRISGDNARIELFFTYQGSIFFIVCAAVELLLAWIAFRQFSQGEPMHAAWMLIMLAALYRFIGYLFSKILNSESYLNPIFLIFGSKDASFYRTCERFGLLVSGPLNMLVLAAGLYLILRNLNRLGMLSKLRAVDYALITAVAGFTIRQAYEIAEWVRTAPAPYDLFKVLSWSSDPLLSILLIEAILIRRSAAQAGWGLLAKSWGAFSLGIFLTSLGDIGIWATTNHNYLPWPYSSITWYIWFLASAAFALGPAYQVEACRRAYREAEYVTPEASAPASSPE
jgi:hypothetical protein